MKRVTILKRALLGGLAVALTLPALGQDAPESLLPPGFGSPVPRQPAQPSAPANSKPAVSAPTRSQDSVAPPRASSVDRKSATTGQSSASGQAVGEDALNQSGSLTAKADQGDESQDDALVPVHFDVPPSARRSLGLVGVVDQSAGGFAANIFGSRDGGYLLALTSHIKGPLASRWGTIMTRRLLASRTTTPSGIAGQDWVAERSWLLLRMGEAALARALIQQVDAGRFNKRLYQVAMPVYLANGDPAGTCALQSGANGALDDPQWKTIRAICSSFAGEQGSATSFLRQSRSRGWVKGIDYLLTEKAVGAGAQGGRAVKIEWDKVQTVNSWRHGLALTVGLVPPDRLYANASRHMQGWLATAPSVTAADRMKAADEAAALGTLSNRAMVSLYALGAEEGDEGDESVLLASQLQKAYTGSDEDARLDGMRKLWSRSGSENLLYSMEVLTARAAALMPPGDYAASDIDELLASLLSAGYDRQAAAWADQLSAGSLGWAIVAVGRPGRGDQIEKGAFGDFVADDESDRQKKSKFLLAALYGLGRIDSNLAKEMASDLEFRPDRQSIWSREITKAAARGERGTVVLLAAAGMQAKNWQAMPARHLYFIVRALNAVGMGAEARMIAAEAVTRG